MSFSPTFSRYINFATQSYIEPSSSIGPTGIDTLVSNNEWNYHNVNSQVLINSNHASYTPFSSSLASGSNVNSPFLIKKFGPIKLNLNKLGMPQAMFIAYKGGVLTSGGTSQGYFTFVFNTDGTTNQKTNWLSLTSSIQSSVSTNYQTLSGSYEDLEGNLFSVSASVNTAPNNQLSIIKSNTNKTSSINDASQLACLTYLSIFYTITSASVPTAFALPAINAVYVREVNSYLP